MGYWIYQDVPVQELDRCKLSSSSDVVLVLVTPIKPEGEKKSLGFSDWVELDKLSPLTNDEVIDFIESGDTELRRSAVGVSYDYDCDGLSVGYHDMSREEWQAREFDEMISRSVFENHVLPILVKHQPRSERHWRDNGYASDQSAIRNCEVHGDGGGHRTPISLASSWRWNKNN